MYIYIYIDIDMSTQEWGASHEDFGALVRTALPLFRNHTFAHDLPATPPGGKKQVH